MLLASKGTFAIAAVPSIFNGFQAFIILTCKNRRNLKVEESKDY